MSVVDAARTLCSKGLNLDTTEPPQNFAFFHRGRKIPWNDNFNTLQDYKVCDSVRFIQ